MLAESDAQQTPEFNQDRLPSGRQALSASSQHGAGLLAWLWIAIAAGRRSPGWPRPHLGRYSRRIRHFTALGCNKPPRRPRHFTIAKADAASAGTTDPARPVAGRTFDPLGSSAGRQAAETPVDLEPTARRRPSPISATDVSRPAPRMENPALLRQRRNTTLRPPLFQSLRAAKDPGRAALLSTSAAPRRWVVASRFRHRALGPGRNRTVTGGPRRGSIADRRNDAQPQSLRAVFPRRRPPMKGVRSRRAKTRLDTWVAEIPSERKPVHWDAADLRCTCRLVRNLRTTGLRSAYDSVRRGF